MRLINTTTYELEEFVDERGVGYAILSHRWLDGEVSFQQFQSTKPFPDESDAHQLILTALALITQPHMAKSNCYCNDPFAYSDTFLSISQMETMANSANVCAASFTRRSPSHRGGLPQQH
jgi:hypothetical protein